MRELESWRETNASFREFARSLAGRPFVTMPAQALPA
jgi:hypothetical protein